MARLRLCQLTLVPVWGSCGRGCAHCSARCWRRLLRRLARMQVAGGQLAPPHCWLQSCRCVRGEARRRGCKLVQLYGFGGGDRAGTGSSGAQQGGLLIRRAPALPSIAPRNRRRTLALPPFEWGAGLCVRGQGLTSTLCCHPPPRHAWMRGHAAPALVRMRPWLWCSPGTQHAPSPLSYNVSLRGPSYKVCMCKGGSPPPLPPLAFWPTPPHPATRFTHVVPTCAACRPRSSWRCLWWRT